MHKVYRGDSRDMNQTSDGVADLVIFDPPLWNHVRYSEGAAQLGNASSRDMYLEEMGLVGLECVRAMKEGGVLLTTVPDVFLMEGGRIVDTVSFHNDLYNLFHRLGLRLISTVTVLIGDDKVRDFVPADENAFRSREDMRTARTIILQAFVKGECPTHLRPKVVLDYWQNVKRFGSHSTILGFRWLYRLVTKILSWGILRKLVNALRLKKRADNVTDYPVRASYEMFDWAIQSWTRPGDIVVDPFLGTGTTLAVCDKSGRSCVGYEINQQAYVSIAKCVGSECEVEFIGWGNPDIQ